MPVVWLQEWQCLSVCLSVSWSWWLYRHLWVWNIYFFNFLKTFQSYFIQGDLIIASTLFFDFVFIVSQLVCILISYLKSARSVKFSPDGVKYVITFSRVAVDVLWWLSFWLTVPRVQFRQPVYTGEESDGHITATVYRSGDIRHKSTARCYTRQSSAQVASDFDERPNTETSIITFLPGINL